MPRWGSSCGGGGGCGGGCGSTATTIERREAIFSACIALFLVVSTMILSLIYYHEVSDKMDKGDESSRTNLLYVGLFIMCAVNVVMAIFTLALIIGIFMPSCRMIFPWLCLWLLYQVLNVASGFVLSVPLFKDNQPYQGILVMFFWLAGFVIGMYVLCGVYDYYRQLKGN